MPCLSQTQTRWTRLFSESLSLSNAHPKSCLMSSHLSGAVEHPIIHIMSLSTCLVRGTIMRHKNLPTVWIKSSFCFVLFVHLSKKWPSRGCFGWVVLALLGQKRIFLRTNKADQKHCENGRCDSGSEFHRTGFPLFVDICHFISMITHLHTCVYRHTHTSIHVD